jgi:hypothetical protein
MKKSLAWRLLVLVAGTLLGLLASLGLSAPASAAAPSSVAAASFDTHRYGANLDLDVKTDGRFVVNGDNYKAMKVYVKVVKINKNGRYNVIAHKHVRTHNGGFDWTGKKLQCGKTYQAHSYSYKDGWNSSSPVNSYSYKDGWNSSSPVNVKC